MPRNEVKLRVARRPIVASVAGLAGALAAHALLILPFVLDLSAAPRKLPDKGGAGATFSYAASDTEMTVVLIDDPSPPLITPPPQLEAVASRGLTSRALSVVVLSPDPSPVAEAERTVVQESADSTAESADPAQHALMYGRYVGQMQARIDRAWMRPRTEIGAAQFSCRARIEQDRRGDVVDVSLNHCNGGERWQQSLVSAIRTASPLPAPPDPSVYADVLWLTFASGPFEDGSSGQGFEPETRVADRSALESFKQFAGGSHNGGDDTGNSNVSHLTITGTPAGGTPQGSPEQRPNESEFPDPSPQ
jgi:TonB-like protein